MNRSTCRRVAVFAAVLLLTRSAWGGVVVQFDVADVTVELGNVFELDIVAEIDEPVLGWGLDLTIDDTTVVSPFGAPVIDPAWHPASFTPDGDGLAALAFPCGLAGTQTLATVTFSADSLGDTFLYLGADHDDLTEGFALDSTGFAEITFEPGHVNVVPLPATALLLLAGAGVACRRPLRLSRRSWIIT